MSGWEMKIITAEARRLLALAAEDAELRAGLRALAEEILAATGAGESRGLTSRAEEPPGPAPAAEPLRELTLGRSRPPADVGPPATTADAREPAVDDDLDALEARCRQKAEAVRWATERRRRLGEGVDVPLRDAPGEAYDVEWAEGLADGLHWQAAPDGAHDADLERLDDVAGCFEAVAEALALVHGAQGRPRGLERALPLLAEAQSALRASIRAVDGPDDPHQRQAFEWLKAAAARHHVFIRRFMRADDLADATRWPGLLDRIEGASQEGPRAAGAAQRPARKAPAAHRPTPEVAEAARLLAGKGVVLIGGLRRREAEEALKTALRLEDLIWVETKEHQATSTFEPVIARPDVALVLLAIRWSSHAFGDVKQYCDRHGKPLVRLPAGYNPNQVASQVLAQCSGQLGRD